MQMCLENEPFFLQMTRLQTATVSVWATIKFAFAP